MRNNKDITGNKNPNYKNGLAPAYPSKRSGLYISWQNMRRRCLTKTHPAYKNWGGRGIKIYEDWNDINKFCEWAINNGFEEGLSLDRINNDGNYEPSNCRWIPRGLNSRYKRTTKLNKNLVEEIKIKLKNGLGNTFLAKQYGVSQATISLIKTDKIWI